MRPKVVGCTSRCMLAGVAPCCVMLVWLHQPSTHPRQ